MIANTFIWMVEQFKRVCLLNIGVYYYYYFIDAQNNINLQQR